MPSPVFISLKLCHVKVSIRLVGEDVQSHLCALLLDVLDEESNLHGSSNLLPDGGHPGGVPHQGVHGDPILDDQGSDGDFWQQQHVKDEELLTTWCCWVYLVASNPPDGVLHALQMKRLKYRFSCVCPSGTY
jgi:hypothetical protein